MENSYRGNNQSAEVKSLLYRKSLKTNIRYIEFTNNFLLTHYLKIFYLRCVFTIGASTLRLITVEYTDFGFHSKTRILKRLISNFYTNLEEAMPMFNASCARTQGYADDPEDVSRPIKHRRMGLG